MTRPKPTLQDDVQAPARVQADHVQDRTISPVAGAKKAWRRKDGLDLLMQRKLIGRHQMEAAKRLQDDYQMSNMEAGAKSGGERTSGSRRGHDIPQAAIDADRRLRAALAILPPELLSMTVLFLLPHMASTGFSLEHIAKRVGEDKRAITLGIRVSLSLLSRHYGN